MDLRSSCAIRYWTVLFRKLSVKLQTENRGSGGGFWGGFWGGFGRSWVNFGAINRSHMLWSKLKAEKVVPETRGGR